MGGRRSAAAATAVPESVLHDTARRAGALLQAAALISDLRASRERIVAAREEERRRLRHDLHDGVGPQLAGLALQLDYLARRLSDDTDSAARVQLLRDRLRDTVVEVRHVVDNLRPPALDDVGLVEAVRQQVSAYAVVSAGNGAGPLVHVASDPLPQLSAAVEVAAYRIITESVANAIRHARPSHCDVTITTVGGALRLTVVDQPDITVVAAVADGRAAIAATLDTHVDLVLMDLRMPDVGGIETPHR